MEIRNACISDVPGIVALVERFSSRGEVLPRTLADVYQTIREWVVAQQGDKVVGCGSLVILWEDLAEIRSLVVAPEMQGMGIGRGLVTALMTQAAELDLPHVTALTRQTEFFHRMGFRIVPRETLPRKIWKDCAHCMKFVGCDEVAMVMAVEFDGERLQLNAEDRSLYAEQLSAGVLAHST